MLAQLKAEKDTVDSLVIPVGIANSLFEEAQRLQETVDNLERKLDVHAPEAKSLEEVESDLQVLEKNRSIKLSSFS